MHEIRCVQVTKQYASDGPAAINAASLTFFKGTGAALVGTSGAGKSTLLHLIAGITRPTSGDIIYGNHSSATYTAADWQLLYGRHIGILFQQPYLLSELTVLENVMLKGMALGLEYAHVRDDAYELLTCAGLADKAHAQSWQLSGGQQQRVALMRALSMRPDFLLADEPTGNLDAQTGQQIIDLLCSLQQQWGMGIILSTHDMALASRMHYCYTLNQGCVAL